MWQFDAGAYGGTVAALLVEGGQRLMPLVQEECIAPDARQQLWKQSARLLFSQAAHPMAAYSGLWLYLGCWQEAHEAAQDDGSAEGSYWHAILHRQEPDAWNSHYWFRRVGAHAIFPRLHEAATAIAAQHPESGFAAGSRWDPERFVEYCGQAQPGSAADQCAREIQRAEWQLLFDFCARPR